MNHAPFDQFLLLEDAAQLLALDPAELRRAIACGVVPIRRDNKGRIRVHRNEVPDNLAELLVRAEVVPELQIEAHADEITSLTEKLHQSDLYRNRLESLLEQQSHALDRSAKLLDAHADSSIVAGAVASDNAVSGDVDLSQPVTSLSEANVQLQKQQTEISKLSALLSRAFNAIEQREQLIATETGQLAGTADKAMEMLDRAISDGEKSSTEASRLSALMEQVTNSSSRLEKEIDQRNAMIDNQHSLMDRLVKLSERSVDAAPVGTGQQATHQGAQQAPKRKLSFWQRLWRGRRGI